MAHTIALVIALVLVLFPTSMHAQIKWFKYEGNPVFNVGPAGSWDGVTVHADRVIFTDSVYQMWYMGFDGATAGRIGRATSRDGITWTKDTRNPIVREGAPGSWESKGSVHPYVLLHGSTYRMWYMGVNDGFNYRLGTATSPDGVVWTKDSLNPILGPGSWYSVGPTFPTILPGFSDELHMWFAGENAGHYLQIGYASGRYPGVEWTAHPNPVVTVGAPGSWDDRNVFGPRVLFDGESGSYQMWYGGERSDFKSHFGYATSTDGIIWTKDPANPVFPRGTASWESNDIAFPEVLFDGKLYHMWYSGNDGSNWRVGYAVSPKDMEVAILPERDTIDRSRDTVQASVRVRDPAGLEFAAIFRSPSGGNVDTLQLFDDGVHEDGLIGDGLFANRWIPGDRNTYDVTLQLIFHDTLRFSEAKSSARFAVTALSDQAASAPLEYSLDQNYPNPFNPTTVVSSQLPVTSDVRLVVYDVLGREMAILVNERRAAGTYKDSFDASGLASGIYLYRLTAGSFVRTRKMILVR